MPTGYTSRIADGISFEEFIMDCARAFGVLITMRDDSMDKPIPEKFEPSDYHKNKLQEIEKELVEVKVISIRKAAIKAKKEYQTALNDKENDIRKANKLRANYLVMLGAAQAWQPPTPDHQGLKNFMTQQIKDSIKFDCSTSYYEKQQINLLSGQEWKTERIQQLQKDLAYHTKEHLEEIKRVAGRNDWLQKLRNSIGHTSSGR